MMTDLQNRAKSLTLFWRNWLSKEMGKDSAEIMFHAEQKGLTWSHEKLFKAAKLPRLCSEVVSFFVVVHKSMKHIYN